MSDFDRENIFRSNSPVGEAENPHRSVHSQFDSSQIGSPPFNSGYRSRYPKVDDAEENPGPQTPAPRYRLPLHMEPFRSPNHQEPSTPAHNHRSGTPEAWTWQIPRTPLRPIYESPTPAFQTQQYHQPWQDEQDFRDLPDDRSLSGESEQGETEEEADYPRIKVTQSMLHAYTHMRGYQREGTFDPLHDALYTGEDRAQSKYRFVLPSFPEHDLSEGLERGATFFWDPLVSISKNKISSKIEPSVRPNKNISRSWSGSLSYGEYTQKHPTSVGLNHSKGDKVYDNFGYLLVGDKWVDPDSERELFEGYKNNKSLTEEAQKPNFQRSQHAGERIMSFDEEDEFYSWYDKYVSDDMDGEGDPRPLRITPETFCQWATGALKGDQYEEKLYEPPAKLILSNITRTPEPPTPRQYQVDEETGSRITDFEEHSSNPSLVHTVTGADMLLKIPNSYHQSYPRAAMNLQRAAFGPAWTDLARPYCATTSTVETINRERICLNFETPGDSGSGVQAYDAAMFKRAGQRHELTVTSAVTTDLIDANEMDKLQDYTLTREITLLKHRLKNKKEEKTFSFSDLFLEEESIFNSHMAASEPTPPLEPRPRRKLYERAIAETDERHELELSRLRMIYQKETQLRTELKGKIAESQSEKAALLEQLGVEDIDEIPDLPEPKGPRISFEPGYKQDESIVEP